jgi:glutamyl-tRNA reductase
MNFLIVGLNHKSAPIEIREKLSFPSETIQEPLTKLCSLKAINEGVILSTCNRVEVMGVTNDVDRGLWQMKSFLSSFHSISMPELDPHLYTYSCEEAVRHIFRVACSLDSMVVGEPQILGQVKEAFGYATEYETAGVIINKLFHKAFNVAKRVRTETKISSNAVSISYAAVELAKKIFGELQGKSVMLIGAGEMGELAARHLVNNGIREIFIANRTFERAVNMAKGFNGTPVMLREIVHYLKRVDIIITSTASRDFIITPEMVKEAMRERRNSPAFFIDIAVPRNIDPKVNKVSNVYLFDVDSLQNVVAANLKEREKEARYAEKIVMEELEGFCQWVKSLNVVPTIKSLRERFEEIRKQEVEKTLPGLKNITEKEKKSLEAMTSAIINKILHHPVTHLKKDHDSVEGDLYIEATRKLFNLDDKDESSETFEGENSLKKVDRHKKN